MIDAIDKRILSSLQRDGRLTITELADEVGLSVSPCHRRLKILEEKGVIQGYHAQLSEKELGLNFSAVVFVSLTKADSETVASFERKLEDIPEVIEAHRLFGDPDYLIKVVTRDLDSFRVLYDSRLSALPNVLRLNSTLVMKTVVNQRMLPV